MIVVFVWFVNCKMKFLRTLLNFVIFTTNVILQNMFDIESNKIRLFFLRHNYIVVLLLYYCHHKLHPNILCQSTVQDQYFFYKYSIENPLITFYNISTNYIKRKNNRIRLGE